MLADLRYALRMLLKSPGFSLIAILTLTLGIGANSAIFSVIETVLLRPLPFPKPNELISVWGQVGGETEREVASFPDYADIRDGSHMIDGLFAYTLAATVLGTGNESRQLEGLAVTADISRVLGVGPFLGRTFTREEETKRASVVVLTYEAWQRYFNADRQIIGRDILLSLRPYTVIGVMPPGYRYPLGAQCEYFLPLQNLVPETALQRGAHFLHLVGRLRADVSVDQASAEVAAIGNRLEKQYPDSNTGRRYHAMLLHSDIVGDVRPALLTILGAVVLVLFIACANVANLLLARGTQRRREMAIRTALGASRFRVVRQLLAEGLILALLGTGAGLILAVWSVDLVRAMGPQDLPRLSEIQVNGGVVLFAIGTALLSTILFALLPALQATRPNVNASLQLENRGAVGPESHRLRALLVIAQVALSMLLLAGAGLLIKSFSNLRSTNPGFDPFRVVTADLALPRVKYAEAPAKQLDFFEQLDFKLRALPGVDAAGGAAPFPFSGNERGSSFWIAGRPDPGLGNHPNASHLMVIGDYFRVMRIPLVSGRSFNVTDTKDSRPVLMVNEAFVRKFFSGANPLGEHVIVDESDKSKQVAREIIGIVANTRHESLAIEPIPEFYIPFAQDPSRRVNIVLRTAKAKLSGLDNAVRNAVHSIDPDAYVPELEPVEKLVGITLAQPRFNMVLLGTFAGAAMILAAIGIYGIIAYNVTQRTKEIGVRMALGAQRGDVLRMILRQSMIIISFGLAIGLFSTFALTRLMTSLLYGVSAHDLFIHSLVVLLLAGAGVIASYIPARRAMKVDPVVALRYE